MQLILKTESNFYVRSISGFNISFISEKNKRNALIIHANDLNMMKMLIHDITGEQIIAEEYLKTIVFTN